METSNQVRLVDVEEDEENVLGQPRAVERCCRHHHHHAHVLLGNSWQRYDADAYEEEIDRNEQTYGHIPTHVLRSRNETRK